MKLSPQQREALAGLAHHGQWVDPYSAGINYRTVDALVRREMIESRPHPTERKNWEYRITDAGRKALRS